MRYNDRFRENDGKSGWSYARSKIYRLDLQNHTTNNYYTLFGENLYRIKDKILEGHGNTLYNLTLGIMDGQYINDVDMFLIKSDLIITKPENVTAGRHIYMFNDINVDWYQVQNMYFLKSQKCQFDVQLEIDWSAIPNLQVKFSEARKKKGTELGATKCFHHNAELSFDLRSIPPDQLRQYTQKLYLFLALFTAVLIPILKVTFQHVKRVYVAYVGRMMNYNTYGIYMENYNNQLTQYYTIVLYVVTNWGDQLLQEYLVMIPQEIQIKLIIWTVKLLSAIISVMMLYQIICQLFVDACNKKETRGQQLIWFFPRYILMIIYYQLFSLLSRFIGVSPWKMIMVLTAIMLLPQIYRNSVHGYRHVPTFSFAVASYIYILFIPCYLSFFTWGKSPNLFFMRPPSPILGAITAFAACLCLFILRKQSERPRWLIPKRLRQRLLADPNHYEYEHYFEDEANRSSLSMISDQDFIDQLNSDPSNRMLRRERTDRRLKKLQEEDCAICLISLNKIMPNNSERAPDIEREAAQIDDTEQMTFEDTDMFFKTPCGHRFHKQCFITWMEQRQQCPICNRVIPMYQDLDD